MSHPADKKPSENSLAYTVQQKANEEGWKLRYDIYKHLTTLSTGSILLVITFLEKIFVRPAWKGLVILALCGFFASILASFLVMNVLATTIGEMKLEEKEEKVYTRIIGFALVTFLLGILSLMVFAVANLYFGNLKTVV